jgi:WD40 repeat protein
MESESHTRSPVLPEIKLDWAHERPEKWGEETFRIPVGGPIESGCVSPDEKLLAIATGNLIEIYLLTDFSRREQLETGPENVIHIEWQPLQEGEDGYNVLVCLEPPRRPGPRPNWKSTCAIWKLGPDGRFVTSYISPTNSFPNTTTYSLTSTSFSHDGRQLLLCPSPTHWQLRPGVINHYEAATAKTLHNLHGHHDNVMWAGFSPDDSVIASSSWDQTLKIWDTKSGNLLRSFGPSGGQNCAASFSPDGLLIAQGCGGAPDTARIWNVLSGECVWKIESPDWCRSFDWNPNSALLAFGSGRIMHVQDVESRVLIHTWRTSGELEMLSEGVYRGSQAVNHVHWIDGGRKLYVQGGGDHAFEVHDLHEKVKWRVEPPNPVGMHWNHSPACYLAARKLLLSFDWDNSVRLWTLSRVRRSEMETKNIT